MSIEIRQQYKRGDMRNYSGGKNYTYVFWKKNEHGWFYFSPINVRARIAASTYNHYCPEDLHIVLEEIAASSEALDSLGEICTS